MPRNYNNYTLEDLLENRNFIAWCNDPNPVLERFWKKWLQQHPEYQDIFEEAKQMYVLAILEQTVYVPKGIREKTLDSIMNNINKDKNKPIISLKVKILTFVQKYAAAALLVAALGCWFLLYEQQSNTLVKIEYINAIKHLTLPDGTKLTLNKGASIIYDEKGGTRTLHLKGEAFLNVAKQFDRTGMKKPFVVSMDKMEVKVLGTRFNAVNKDDLMVITLQEGKVKVTGGNRYIIMDPGEKVTLKGNELIRKKVNPSLYTAWLSGTLNLNNTSLEEILHWLEDSRGFVIEDDLTSTDKRKKLSGNLNLENEGILFKTLESAFDIQLIKDQRKLLVKKSEISKI